MMESGVITRGMIPKVEACLKAAESGVRAVITDGRRAGALLEAVGGRGVGDVVRIITRVIKISTRLAKG